MKKKIRIRALALWSSAILCFFAVATAFSARLIDSLEPPTEESEAVSLLDVSMRRLERTRAISADVETVGYFFGDRYRGRGRYAESSNPGSFGATRREPFETAKFLLEVSLTDSKLTEDEEDESASDDDFLSIVCDCDGLSWWSYSSICGTKTLRRIDIEELWNRFSDLDEAERATLAANGVPEIERGLDAAPGLNALPGLGGLLGSLKRIRACYAFEPNVGIAESDEGGERFYKIVGRQTKASRKLLELSTLEELDDSIIPTIVEIYFDSETAFPRKIRFLSDVDGARSELFSVAYKPNSDPVRPEDFRYEQPQSTFERAEIPYLEKLIPGVRL